MSSRSFCIEKLIALATWQSMGNIWILRFFFQKTLIGTMITELGIQVKITRMVYVEIRFSEQRNPNQCILLATIRSITLVISITTLPPPIYNGNAIKVLLHWKYSLNTVKFTFWINKGKWFWHSPFTHWHFLSFFWSLFK